MTSNSSDGAIDSRFFSTKRISVLLDDNTYLLWRQQVLLAVKVHKLQSFLEPQQDPPTQFLADGNGGFHENPEFAHFEQQNSALASWLLSSISQTVLLHLIALHSQRKGELSMKEFLMKVKSCCDNLASCGEIVGKHEHVTTILNGLPPEYESVITIVTVSQVPYTVQGITSMLLDTEARQQVVSNEVSSSANLVSSESSDTSGSIPTY
ncbi:hypothetical protein Gogos_019859 [Gossypium gossypioides]|uniref:Retrotransposon Copia-like N-terminal domain-containing protein n=1 Tax=Gossypium gossypioides TaxID=34282 RepID=A0A7J9CYW7_GOSGO|nr:hypothetical protein [Gossypium gossypioides]